MRPPPRGQQDAAVLGNICCRNVTKVDPDRVLGRATDPADVLHYPSEHSLAASASRLGDKFRSACFTDPELARVGLSEKEAKARGVPYRLFKIAMADAVLRVHTLSETRGLLKALVETDSDRILGLHRLRRGCWRAHGVGTGCHDWWTALHCTAGRHPGPSDTDRRTWPVVRVSTLGVETIRFVTKRISNS